jgi:hypothetical protein
MVMAAVMILMFLSMAALAIDYGMVKTAKAEAQRAMDGAALAGASVFTEPSPTFNKDSGAKARAKALAVQHTVHRMVVDTTAAHMAVAVDLVNSNVTATYTVPPMSLWFARRFGSSTMSLTATAKAHAENTDFTNCTKPVAIPDAWNNVTSSGEDPIADNIWGFQDKPGGSPGVWDEGETEPWLFNGSDAYDSTTTGWGTDYRNGNGTGMNLRTKDYGRQIFIQSFSHADDAISSFYYSWGNSTSDNGASKLHDRILAQCEPAQVQHTYAAANGAKTNQVSDAWDQLIDRDPNAVWDNSTNTVINSNKGANWLTQSDRVIVVGLFNPSAFSGCPSCNTIQFNNMARVFLDKRPCGNGHGNCKQPLTGHFLGLVGGGGGGGTPSGSLLKRLVLIK